MIARIFILLSVFTCFGAILFQHGRVNKIESDATIALSEVGLLSTASSSDTGFAVLNGTAVLDFFASKGNRSSATLHGRIGLLRSRDLLIQIKHSRENSRVLQIGTQRVDIYGTQTIFQKHLTLMGPLLLPLPYHPQGLHPVTLPGFYPRTGYVQKNRALDADDPIVDDAMGRILTSVHPETAADLAQGFTPIVTIGGTDILIPALTIGNTDLLLKGGNNLIAFLGSDVQMRLFNVTQTESRFHSLLDNLVHVQRIRDTLVLNSTVLNTTRCEWHDYVERWRKFVTYESDEETMYDRGSIDADRFTEDSSVMTVEENVPVSASSGATVQAQILSGMSYLPQPESCYCVACNATIDGSALWFPFQPDEGIVDTDSDDTSSSCAASTMSFSSCSDPAALARACMTRGAILAQVERVTPQGGLVAICCDITAGTTAVPVWAQREVFVLNSSEPLQFSDANALCSVYGSRLATRDEVATAWTYGTQWCELAWLRQGIARTLCQHPSPTVVGCPFTDGFLLPAVDYQQRSIYAAACYGVRPVGLLEDVLLPAYASNTNASVVVRSLYDLPGLHALLPQAFHRRPYNFLPAEVFVLNYTSLLMNFTQAQSACDLVGAVLATTAQVDVAATLGASWCNATAWTSDGRLVYPCNGQTIIADDRQSTPGLLSRCVTCYGIRVLARQIPRTVALFLPWSPSQPEYVEHPFALLDSEIAGTAELTEASLLHQYEVFALLLLPGDKKETLCATYNAVGATRPQMYFAWLNGADWSVPTYVAPGFEVAYAMSGSGVGVVQPANASNTAVACFGPKPSSAISAARALPFYSDNVNLVYHWSVYDSTPSMDNLRIERLFSGLPGAVLPVRPEVFLAGMVGKTEAQAATACGAIGRAELASYAMMEQSWKLGARWNIAGIVRGGKAYYIADGGVLQGAAFGSNVHGAVCYGVKPEEFAPGPIIYNWNIPVQVWSMYDGTSAEQAVYRFKFVNGAM